MQDFFKQNMSASLFRKEAHKICKKQMGKAIGILLLYLLFSFGISLVEGIFVGVLYLIQSPVLVSGILTTICSCAVQFSFIIVASKMYRDQKLSSSDLFSGFKYWIKSFCIYFLTSLYIFLWSLLIIPAFIKPFSYAMAPYIAIDNPELSANQCITESRKMMNGYKWKLFCLHFSYIGWYFLCGLTLGILTLWVTPKVRQAEYLFYLKVSGKGIEMEDKKEANPFDEVWSEEQE